MMSEEDKKEHLSRVYAYAVATSAGFAFIPVEGSYDRDSIDALIRANGRVNENSVDMSAKIELQLKCTTRCILDDDRINYKLPISMKTYNDLRANRATPAILVVLFLPKDDTVK